MERARVRNRLLRATQLWLGHNLEQRGAGAVEVDAGHARKRFVQGFAGILLQVGAGQAHHFLADAQLSALDDGHLVLADLVSLRQVRVEVVFAREDRAPVDRAVHRQAKTHGMLERGAVEHRQRAGQRKVYRRRLRIRRRAKVGGRAGKNLAPGEQVRVSLHADDDFPAHGYLAPWRSSSQWPRRSTRSGSR
jgi:hypothetical protein